MQRLMAVSDTSTRRGIGYNEESIGKIFVGGAQYITILVGKPAYPFFFLSRNNHRYPFSLFFYFVFKTYPWIIFPAVLAMMMGQTGSLVFPSQVGYELTTCSQDGICQLVSEKELVGPCLLGLLFRCFEST